MCTREEIEGTGQTGQGRGVHDRPGDPLFPLIPRVLEVLRARAAERAASEGRELGGADEYARIIESICGAADDSQPVEQYDGTLGVTQAFVANHQRCVGQIQWNDGLGAIYTNPGNVSGVRWCSGTMISDDLFLTAGHCFDQTGGGWERPRVNGTTNIIPPAEIATNMHVNFNFQVDPMGAPRPVAVFAITQLVEYRLGGLDFAIVRLAGNPGAAWGRATVSTTDAAAGEMLCIMGHPQGVPKRIEAGPALAPAGDRIRYDDIDTQGGNSGSGVLRASDGRLVGVHTNGGCGPTSPNGSEFNFGQRIAAVLAASPTLQALTQPTKIPGDAAWKRLVDGPRTLKVFDDGGTLRALDVGGTYPALDAGTFKAVDDVKLPALDKALQDWIPALDPRWAASGGVARPFALAHPHHAPVWTGEASGAASAQAHEKALAELGDAIQQQQQILAALEAQLRALAERLFQG
jgi:V8-like Glu-specific endopeptidase